jgi:hypothetical protein
VHGRLLQYADAWQSCCVTLLRVSVASRERVSGMASLRDERCRPRGTLHRAAPALAREALYVLGTGHGGALEEHYSQLAGIPRRGNTRIVPVTRASCAICATICEGRALCAWLWLPVPYVPLVGILRAYTIGTREQREQIRMIAKQDDRREGTRGRMGGVVWAVAMFRVLLFASCKREAFAAALRVCAA